MRLPMLVLVLAVCIPALGAGSVVDECDRVAASPADWRDELYVEEAGRVAPYAYQIERDGEYLTLRFSAGKRIVLVSSPDGCDGSECTSYFFEGYISSLDSFLVRIAYYESEEYLVVNRRTAVQTTVVAYPIPDPSAQRFIAVLADEMNGYQIQMWRLTPEGPVLEFAYDPPLPYRFVAWRSPDDVELAEGVGDAEKAPAPPFHLVRAQDQWRLVGPDVDVPMPTASHSAFP